MWWYVLGPFFLFACGTSSAPTPGLPGGGGGYDPDAAIEAPLDPRNAVTVTVTLDGVPQPGVVVYFQSSYLGPSTELRTDASGSTAAAVPVMLYDTTSVTLVNPFGPLDAMTDELVTYNSVKTGDHIEVPRVREPPPSISFTLTAPVDSPAATHYQLHTNCGVASIATAPSGAQVGGAVTLRGCGATVDMLVESFDASSQSLSWLYQPDVAVSDGGSVELTGSYQPSRAKTFSYNTLSVVGSRLEIVSRFKTGKGIVYQSPTAVLPISYMNYQPSLTVALPSVPGAVAITETVYQAGTSGVEHTVDWGPSLDRYTLDLEPFGSFLETYQSPPTLANGRVGYTYSGGVVNADYMRARIAIERHGDRNWEWQLFSPLAAYGGGSQSWPQIPSDVHHYNTLAGDVVRVEDATLVYAPGGYDAIRARALSIASPLAQLTGPSGRLVYEGMLPP